MPTTTPREAKRQRPLDDFPAEALRNRAGGDHAFVALQDEAVAEEMADARYLEHHSYYIEHGVSNEVFNIGVHRNVFDEGDFLDTLGSIGVEHSYAASPAQMTRGRKEVVLSHLSSDHRELCTGKGGADEREWQSWLDLDACEVMIEEEARQCLLARPIS